MDSEQPILKQQKMDTEEPVSRQQKDSNEVKIKGVLSFVISDTVYIRHCLFTLALSSLLFFLICRYQL